MLETLQSLAQTIMMTRVPLEAWWIVDSLKAIGLVVIIMDLWAIIVGKRNGFKIVGILMLLVVFGALTFYPPISHISLLGFIFYLGVVLYVLGDAKSIARRDRREATR